jgi:hypothetical protein
VFETYNKNIICFASVFDIYLLHPPAATILLSQKPYATVTKHKAYSNKIACDVRETHTTSSANRM